MHLGHPVVLMDKWDAERMLELIDRYRVTTRTWCRRSSTACWRSPRRCGRSTTRRRPGSWSTPPRRARSRVKQQMLDWWGDSIYEYYAATEGGGTIVSPAEWRETPGHRRQGVGRAPRSRSSTTTATSCRPARSGTIWMPMGQADFETTRTIRTRPPRRRTRRLLHRRRRRLPRRGRLPVPVRSQDRHDHLAAGSTSTRPRSRACSLDAPEGRRRRRVRRPQRGLGRGGQGRHRAGEPGIEAGRRTRGAAADLGRGRTSRATSARATYDFTDDMPRDPSGKLYKRKLRDPYWEGRDRSI